MTDTPTLPVLESDGIGPRVGTRFPDLRLPDQMVMGDICPLLSNSID